MLRWAKIRGLLRVQEAGCSKRVYKEGVVTGLKRSVVSGVGIDKGASEGTGCCLCYEGLQRRGASGGEGVVCAEVRHR
mgnify:CR=1 FL=1